MPALLGPPFTAPTAAARNDLLSAERVNAMVRNHLDTRALVLAAHNFDGKHNALEVCRGVGAILDTAGVPTIESDSSNLFVSATGFTSGASPVVGVATITLNTDLLTGDNYVIRACPIDSLVENVPLVCNVERVSASQVRVYCWKLTSLAGNTWALTDFDFAIAVHSNRYPNTGTAWTSPVGVQNENGLIENDVNRQTEGVASMYRYAQEGHLSSGEHAIREVARAWGVVTWEAPDYVKVAGSASMSVTVVAVSTGIARVDFTADALVLPMQVFNWDGYDTDAGQPNDLCITNFPASWYVDGATPSFRAYSYQYDPNTLTWARADTSFAFQVHSANL